jgi:hypothetical protein
MKKKTNKVVIFLYQKSSGLLPNFEMGQGKFRWTPPAPPDPVCSRAAFLQGEP